MPRTARLTFKNSFYHIITRGNQKQLIFLNDPDRARYLRILQIYKNKYRFKLYCFCLMPNHVHLLIEVAEPLILNKIMRGINLSYALYFNNKYSKVGHLWQDRFKSKVIAEGNYLIECINYIENNPLRASIVDDLNRYPWTSFNFRKTKCPLLDNLFSP
jgi:REP element-mobilizing transposase RayT